MRSLHLDSSRTWKDLTEGEGHYTSLNCAYEGTSAFAISILTVLQIWEFFSPVTSSSLALLAKAAHMQLVQNQRWPLCCKLNHKIIERRINIWGVFLYIARFHHSIRSQTAKDTRECNADVYTPVHPPPSKNKFWEGNVTPGSPDLSWTLDATTKYKPA